MDKENDDLLKLFQKNLVSTENEDQLLFGTQCSSLTNSFILTMSNFIENSQETTFQGLYLAMKKASELIVKKVKEDNLVSKGTLTLKAVSEIMLNLINKHISRKLNAEFDELKEKLVDLSKDLFLMSTFANEKISKFFNLTMKNGMNILTHGYSSTVLYSLKQAHDLGMNFTVYVTESRPENSGELLYSKLKSLGIRTELILDISVGYFMEKMDCVIVGADAVVENGGIINKIGTFTISICAKAFKKPFYVLAESLKFLRMFPLDQNDVPQNKNKDENKFQSCDYTSPDFITLLFTDLGIFTPSAVSDELIQMFNN